jgi:hypothetical protein
MRESHGKVGPAPFWRGAVGFEGIENRSRTRLANDDLQGAENSNGCGENAGSERRVHWNIPDNNSVELQLLNRIQDGEYEAFYELVQPHQGRVYTALLWFA